MRGVTNTFCMAPESITTLDKHRHHYETYMRANFVSNYDIHVREDLLKIIRKEFDPGYQVTMWCGDCVLKMLTFCYIQYDKWKAVNDPHTL